MTVAEEEIASRELRNAAYHEAGHKILYEYLGGTGDAVVWRNESGNPEERAWFGQFRPRICPEVMRDVALRCGTPARELPSNWRVLAGMAGLLAEEILDWASGDIESFADGLLYRITSGEASASDLKLMNIADTGDCEVSFEDVGETVRILREGWRGVLDEAEYLIAFAATESAR